MRSGGDFGVLDAGAVGPAAPGWTVRRTSASVRTLVGMVNLVSSDGLYSDFAAVWRARSVAGGPRPFLTFHDVSCGERVELSFATFGNWLAKTANLVQDDLLAQPGDRVAVGAPPHWVTAVWAVAPLLAGVAVDVWGDPRGAHAAVSSADPDALEAARGCRGERFALSLLPLGRAFDVVPEGFRDYAAEVRAFGDRFEAFTPPGLDTPALVVDGRAVSHAELVESSRGALTAADRVLVDARRDRFTGAELIDWLFAPLLVGASVVVVRGAGSEHLEQIAAMERTTEYLLLG
jgi:uncharacterized protein (TIGR03089 family)